MTAWSSYRGLARSLLAFALSCFVVRPVFAALPSGCGNLGLAITEHSCFHSEFGPFASVQATAGSEPDADTPDVSAVHTEYRIGLAGEYSLVRYTPKRAGHWAILLSSEVPFDVLAGPARAVAPVLAQEGETGCAALPTLRVFELEAGVEHRLVFGPTGARHVVAVIEYIDDFLTENGVDADGDGFGSLEKVVVSPCAPPAGFAPNARDCDDTDPAIHPDGSERCDGVDQNCNGSADDIGLVCRSGAGGCRREGVTECPSGDSQTTCSAAPGTPEPEQCNGVDDDCDGATDELPSESEPLCGAGAPACVRRGNGAFCGCLLDLDCGGVDSGVSCDAPTGLCKVGCSTTSGRNGCPAGFSCDDDGRCIAANEVDGAAGSGGEPSAAGAGAGANGGGRSDPGRGGSVDSGCSCRTAGARSPGAFALLLLVGACAVRRRGERRLGAGWLLFVGSLLAFPNACGGRTMAEGARPGATNESGAPALPPAGGSGGEPECRPTLTRQSITHACSHAEHGPYLGVVSSSGRDVSELHRTYEVQTVGGNGSLRYRAQRSGEHAFMTSAAASLVLTHDGAPAPSMPAFRVEGCAALKHATVYALEAGQEYGLALTSSAGALLLFIEHLGAFEHDGWETRCQNGE